LKLNINNVDIPFESNMFEISSVKSLPRTLCLQKEMLLRLTESDN